MKENEDKFQVLSTHCSIMYKCQPASSILTNPIHGLKYGLFSSEIDKRSVERRKGINSKQSTKTKVPKTKCNCHLQLFGGLCAIYSLFSNN